MNQHQKAPVKLPRGLNHQHNLYTAFSDSSVALHQGDCLEVLRGMPEASVDAIVTAPPYGLSFMGKRWDYDVPSTEIWAECLRVLKPGGHLLAFAGTRTQHRMAVRIEDAGFEIRDMIAWVYGSGFPKSLDVSKAIDKAAGVEREVLSERITEVKGGSWAEHVDSGRFRVGKKVIRETAPATPDAERWQGWGTALKPALEPITVARKPLVGTVAENVLAHGTGALNIDGCRVPAEKATGWGGGGSALYEGGLSREGGEARLQDAGRWPANLIHDGSDEVVALFPAEAGAAAPVFRRNANKFRGTYGAFKGDIDEQGSTFHADSGSAARFFYCAKATRADRNDGCGAMEETPLLWSSGTKNPGSFQAEGTKKAAQNNHPTVKPTALMRYLVRLVTPPGGVVLDPFMGSGSTGRGAVIEGFRFIGIEREEAYVAIARARITAAKERAEKERQEAERQGSLFA